MCLRGGVSTGFHHVSEVPLELFRLYRVGVSHIRGHVAGSQLVVREVAPEASSLVQGDVFVLDKGTKVMQLNTKSSVGKEKFEAAEFVQLVISERKGQCDTQVYGKPAVPSVSELPLSAC
jgi:gelsolin